MTSHRTLLLLGGLFLTSVSVPAQDGLRYDILWKNSFAGDTVRFAVLQGPDLSVAVQKWSEDDLNFSPDNALLLAGTSTGGRVVQVRQVGDVLLTRPAGVDSTELFSPQTREAFGEGVISKVDTVHWRITPLPEENDPGISGFNTVAFRLTAEIPQSWRYTIRDSIWVDVLRLEADIWIDPDFDDGGMMIGTIGINGEPWLAHLLPRVGLPAGAVVRVVERAVIEQDGSSVEYENVFTSTPPIPSDPPPAPSRPFLNLTRNESDIVLSAVVLASMLSMQPLQDSTGSFQAVLTGAEEASLLGRAIYGSEDDHFALRLTPHQPNDPAYGSLVLLSFPSNLPQPGAYSVADIHEIQRGDLPIASFAPLTVLSTPGGLIVLDRVSHGTVTVESSSSERIAGSFRMTASGFLLKGGSERSDFFLEGTFDAPSGWENIPRMQR